MQIAPSDITNSNVLISPLDWGMGHTTRCIAVIRWLIEQNNVVVFAGNESQCAFIKREFSFIKVLYFKGYGVTLDSKKSTYFQMLGQLMKIRRAINRENQEIKNIISSENIHYVISDNRYGFFSANTKNILISHQLNLQLPFLSSMVNRLVRNWLEKFDTIWIPDTAQNSLCGLMVKSDVKTPMVFIGWLCRFKKKETLIKYEYLAIVSGPEPARSDFSKMLVSYLEKKQVRCALVGAHSNASHVDSFLDPDSAQLDVLINSSARIISRAGYTTIMELISLEKEAILIPTPGQFEQEYLAATIKKQGLHFLPETDFLEQIQQSE